MSQALGKPAIIIPAFNEEEWIGRTIDLVKATGIDARIIVVDDGSKDRTAEIARKKGIEVISLPRNFGKANAFFAGLKAALAKNPKAVITLDADMTAVPREGLDRLIAPAVKASSEGKQLMVVAEVLEGERENQATMLSGIRAFSNGAGFTLRKFGKKKLAKGYALEFFLNIFFSGSAVNPNSEKSLSLFKSGFKARAALEDESRRSIQKRDLNAFSSRKRQIVWKKRFPNSKKPRP